MERLSILLLAITLPSATAAASVQTADFYVLPGGSDSWTGTFAEPNAWQSDGPFATLERARDAVRELNQKRTFETVTSCWPQHPQAGSRTSVCLGETTFGDRDVHDDRIDRDDLVNLSEA